MARVSILPPTTICEEMVVRHNAPGLGTLNAAFFRVRTTELVRRLEAPAESALATLPAPVLGALEWCVGGSPLAPACGLMVNAMARRYAPSASDADKQAKLVIDDVQAACDAAIALHDRNYRKLLLPP